LLAAGPCLPATAQEQAPEGIEATAREACSQCHAWPPPEILPRSVWPGRIEEMGENSLLGLGLGGEEGNLWKYSLLQITRFYTERAPEKLEPPEPWPAVSDAPLRFRRHALKPRGEQLPPAISNVRFVDLDGDAHPELVATDMA
jgi:hypothetical protein